MSPTRRLFSPLAFGRGRALLCLLVGTLLIPAWPSPRTPAAHIGAAISGGERASLAPAEVAPADPHLPAMASPDGASEPQSTSGQLTRTAATDQLLHEQFIRLKSELVLLSISVTDQLGRFITGLKPDHFTVYEDNVPQQVKFFSTDDIPISVGLILDVSGSMKSKIARLREAVRRFIEWSNPQDEFFAIAFNKQVTLLADFTDGEVLLTYLPFLRAQGRTALFDAVYEGVLKLRHARRGKRVLLVISDGQDNSSRYSYGALSRLLKESDVQIYTIGTPDPTLYNTYFEQQGIAILQQLSKLTGGRHFTVMGASLLEAVCGMIARELRQQYNIGYVSTNTSRDGKWRRIKIEVAREGNKKFKVHARRGYYAPVGQP